MLFEEYLQGKKIDSTRFQHQEFEKWQVLKRLFEQIHPESFTAQKKFLINDLRRRYLIKSTE